MLYGHIFSLCWYPEFFVRQRYLHALLLGLFAASFLAASFGLARTRRDLTQLSAGLTFGTTLFLLFSLVPWLRDTHSRPSPTIQAVTAINTLPAPPELPDIYFVILDGYARADVLKHDYAFDNGAFLDWLHRRGFYVAERSCANYPLTHLSLSATLSLHYHEDAHARNPRETYFYQLIHRPLAAELLQAHGYRYVQICTNWAGTRESAVADVRLNEDKNPLTGKLSLWLRYTTMARLWDGVHSRLDFADANLRTLESLPTVAAMDGPTFTLAHVIAPHPPYVFDREGRRRSDIDQDSRDSYVDQLVYINARAQAAIDQILARSTPPPIILIQADHGSGYFAQDEGEYFQERLPILNAWLVPEQVRGKLYPTISPVNTFRVLLSEYFGQSYALLPERYFLSTPAQPDLREVTHRVRDGVPSRIAQGPSKSISR